jgi:hypothetical protein
MEVFPPAPQEAEPSATNVHVFEELSENEMPLAQLVEETIVSKLAPVIFTPVIAPPAVPLNDPSPCPTKAMAAPDITTLFDNAVCGMLLVALNCPVPALDGVLAVNDSVPPLAVKLVIVAVPDSGLCHVADVMLVGAVPV